MKILALWMTVLGLVLTQLTAMESGRIRALHSSEGESGLMEEFKALKAAADTGDAAAMFQLSRVYLLESDRDFVQVDGDTETLCQQWLQRAAERGHPEAMFFHAQRLRYSYDEELMSKSFEWMRKSAEAGFGPAMMQLAEAYSGSDDEESADWYKRAVGVGVPSAYGFLAWAYLEGRGVPYNPQKAVDVLTRGAQAKDDELFGKLYAAECMTLLGRLYLEGVHVPKDEAAAAHWLSEAVQHDMSEAKLMLADLHIRGAGVPRDLEKARALVESSAEGEERKAPVLAALVSAEKAEAEARAMRQRVANLAPRVGPAWANRLMAPPPELAGMEPVDVYFMMTEKVAPPPAPNAAVDHNKFIPGTISFSSMRMWLLGSEAEFEAAYQQYLARGGRPYPVRIRGSDLTGGRVILGWAAWVCVNDWWPEGYGYPNEGVGYCYGAASLDEALEIAYARAVQGLRTLYTGPIRCIQVEAGISAKPQWDLYRANKTFSDVCKLTYALVMETPAKERDARYFGFSMTPPEDAKEFPKFARVTMRQRRYAQVITEPNMARGYPRTYGSYGLMNAPVPLNPRLATTRDEVLAAGFPEYFYKEAYFSDEPPAFTILPF